MDVQKSDGTWWLVLASAGKAAAILGCEAVGRKVVLSPANLVGAGWKARVFAAWEHGKKISREQIQKAINVPIRTQTYRDRQSGISHTKNYAKSKLSDNALRGVQEFTYHKAAFVTRDGFVAWRLPDYREADFAYSGRKGRAQKVNRVIQTAMRHEGLFLVQQALTSASERSGLARIFCETPRQLSFVLDQVCKGNAHAQDLYHYNGKRTWSGAVLWDHYPTTA